MAKRHSVAVCESNRLFRDGLSFLLKEEKYRVIAAVSHFRDMGGDTRARSGDLIFLLGQGNHDVGSIANLHRSFPQAKIVLLVECFSEEYLHQVEAAGAQGVLLRSVSREVLVKSLELITLGGRVYSPAAAPGSAALVDDRTGASGSPAEPLTDIHIAGHVHQVAAAEGVRMASGGAWPTTPQLERAAMQIAEAVDVETEQTRLTARRNELSERELEILNCLVTGDSNKVIARNCNISEATVKVHLKAVLRKIRVSNRTQAAVWAMKRMRDETPVAGLSKPGSVAAQERVAPRPDPVIGKESGPRSKVSEAAAKQPSKQKANAADAEDGAKRDSLASDYRRRQASLKILHHII